MEAYARLWTEFGGLLRGLKELSAHAIETSGVRIEVAGAHVLSRLAELGPVRLTDLATALGLDPSSVSRQVSSLERGGWVTREADPLDRRATQLTLTAAGRDVVEVLREARVRALARVAPDWDDAELNALTDRLTRLNHDIATNRALLDASLENA